MPNVNKCGLNTSFIIKHIQLYYGFLHCAYRKRTPSFPPSYTSSSWAA